MKRFIGHGLRLALGVGVMLTLLVAPVRAVGVQTVTIATQVHNANHVAVTSVPVGSEVHPSFVVSGASGTPTGQISVLKWNNGTCSGTRAYAYGGLLTNGALDASFLAETSTDAATISYRGSYKGDGVYAASDGPCKSLTFTKASPSVVVQLHDAAHHLVTSIRVGESVHALVAVNGLVDQPSGTVKVYGWPTGSCSGAASVVGPYTLVNGSVDTPFVWTMSTAGTYAFRATYAGDGTYDPGFSACITLTVQKVAPTFNVGIYDSQGHHVDYVPLDEPVHVAASLSGPVGAPTGTVTLGRYSTSDCSGPAQYTTGITAAPTMDPIGGYFSEPVPMTLSYRLTYLGDSTYATATTCQKVTWRADPTVDLTMRDAADDILTTALVGTAMHPRVVLGPNGNLATGTVTVKWSANGTCSSGTTLGSRTVVAGIVNDTTLQFVPKSAGTYSFRATYGGGPTYQPASSACVVVKITASAPTPTPKPTAKPTQAPAATSTPLPSEAASLDPASAEPAAEPSADPAASPAASLAPVAVGGGATAAADPTATSGGSEPAAASSDTGSGAGIVLWPLLLLLLLAAVLVWVAANGRRRRRGDGEVSR